MAGIIKQVKAPILKLLEELVFADEELHEKITYKFYLDTVHDPNTKRPVTSYKDYLVDAVRMRHTQDTVKISSVAVEVGQPFFLFRAEDLPKASTLSKKDIILDADGISLKVIGIIPVFSIVTGVTVAA